MIRPESLLLGAALAAALGCAEREAPRQAIYAPPSAAAPGAPGAARRVPPQAGVGSRAPSPTGRDRAALLQACRNDADRALLYRDRGQLMREDERDARVGTDASIYARRMETDRLGRAFERDRVAAACLEQDPQSPPARR